MPPVHSELSQDTVADGILALRRQRPRWMFAELAKMLPEFGKQQLFVALAWLQQDHKVELIAYPWDFEIRFLSASNPAIFESQVSDREQREDHETQDL